jgi:hypothetical protein
VPYAPGPGSFLSICSSPGVDWVCEKTRVPDFAQMAKKLINHVSRRSKFLADVRQRLFRSEEPEPEEAWKYVNAYFEIPTSETIFAVVSRASFESRLRAYFKNTLISARDDDVAWYALRNAIYASGCRSHLLVGASNAKFRVGIGHGWQFFQNAMAVLTELVYEATSLMTLQALIIMVRSRITSFPFLSQTSSDTPFSTQISYAESINCPSLGDLLCSNAIRVAVAKGLHRQPPAAMNLDESAIQIRSSIWWSIYTFERHSALQSGRPVVSCLANSSLSRPAPH